MGFPYLHINFQSSFPFLQGTVKSSESKSGIAFAKCAQAVRAKACRMLLATVSLSTHSSLEIPCGFFSRRPQCTQCIGTGKHVVSITTLGVIVTEDKTRKCVLYLGGLCTEQSVRCDMNNITREREKGEVASPRDPNNPGPKGLQTALLLVRRRD